MIRQPAHSQIISKSDISKGIRFAFNTIFPTTISHPLKIEVRRICSPNGILTINLFFSGINSLLACNANVVLTNDQLELVSNKTCAGVPKTIIILVTVSGLAWASLEVITKI